ncbi:MAG: bifunctional pyr operon transcriptional regulator/uracil phosphoribosyltransferase PyrR [Fidelibacterota bacterium]|nr:MAG: bifunctional pyr operon transcriptional regulator/uracil phosphoribosyltransferase PyrR [Candidatus Neomarinimicrobiota bacterium]
MWERVLVKKVKATLMDATGMEQTVTRLAHEIIERHPDLASLALVGIQRRGEFLARRIVEAIRRHTASEVKFGTVDVTFHRDDFRTRLPAPRVGPTKIAFGVDDLHIVLVDDVLFTGRTVRAAMNSLMDFGRPASIELAVLVDRGYRELPIQADYVGYSRPTSVNEQIHVHVVDVDGTDEVLLMEYGE